MAVAKQSSLTYMHFTVFDTDGTTPLTGQAGSCTDALRRNGAASGETVTIAETGSTGRYYASFIPTSLGKYDLEIDCPDSRVLGEEYEVFVNDIDDVDTVVDLIYVDTQAIDGRLPSDPADESLQQASHTQTQADVAALNDPTAGDVADAVWDEARGIHTGGLGDMYDNLDQSLSTTESNIRGADSDDLKDISDEIAALNDPTAALIADAVWDEVRGVHTGGLGTIYDNLDQSLSTTESNIITEIDANETKIDTMQLDVTDILTDTADMQPKVNTINTRVDQVLSTTEGNIRGADSDDLKDISDQIDTLSSDQSTAEGILNELLDLLENKLTINEGTSTLNLWNDTGDTILKTWPLTDKDGNNIALVGTDPANRDTKTLG